MGLPTGAVAGGDIADVAEAARAVALFFPGALAFERLGDALETEVGVVDEGLE